MRTLRNDFYRRFDTIFLHIFPNFIPQFNNLLAPDNQITPKNGELLNAELRIFALIRLGINDNNQIAILLDYSINTIYTYKTKVKNASHLSNEQFHQQLMQIVYWQEKALVVLYISKCREALSRCTKVEVKKRFRAIKK